jgi:hypothetical protein
LIQKMNEATKDKEEETTIPYSVIIGKTVTWSIGRFWSLVAVAADVNHGRLGLGGIEPEFPKFRPPTTQYRVVYRPVNIADPGRMPYIYESSRANYLRKKCRVHK